MSDNFWMLLANYAPRRLVYYCAIRLGAHATCGKHGSQIVPELYFMDALERWGEAND